MKRGVLIGLVLIACVNVFGDRVLLSGLDITFNLPQLPVGEPGTDPFAVVRADSQGRDGIVIKFPQIYSKEYNMLVSGNLSIQTEKVPDGTTSKDFFLSNLHFLFSLPGSYANGDDDLVLGTSLPGKMDALLKNDNGKMKTNIFMLGSVTKGVGILLLFEVSDDLYVFCRPIVQEIVKSVAIK